MARARLIGSGTARPVGGVWALATTTPDRAQTPADLETLALDWIPCEGPMPVAAALRAAGKWDLDHPRDFDAEEWWYRCRFTSPAADAHTRLHFEGLATIADVWLNGTHILSSESMFAANAVDVSGVLAADNELFIRFRALAPLLAARRPRPKWRTRLVAHQQLRWHRTALLGRAPGWCPPVAPVGPWRPVLIERACPLRVEETDIRTALEGDDGIVRASIHLTGAAAIPRSGTVRTWVSRAARSRVNRWLTDGSRFRRPFEFPTPSDGGRTRTAVNHSIRSRLSLDMEDSDDQLRSRTRRLPDA